MDYDLQQAAEEDAHITQDSENNQSKNKQSNGKITLKKAFTTLLVLIIIAGLVYGAWWYKQEQNDKLNQRDERIAGLEQENSELRNQISDLETQLEEVESDAISEEVLNDIRAAMVSGDYADLVGLMHDEVMVVIAPAEAASTMTSVEAVGELTYFDDANEPWNFSLDDETVQQFTESEYGEYISDTAFVGQSENEYVVAFDFGDGMISSVLMAAANDLQ